MSELLRLWARRLIPGLLILLVALLAWGNLAFVQRAPAQSPWVARWTGLRAWLTQGGSPFDPSVSLDAQTRIYGRPANLQRGEDPQHFLYPPAVAVVLGPFALLPLPIARALWMTLLQVLLVALTIIASLTFRWSMTGGLRFAASALVLLSLPGVLAVLQGDVAVFVVLMSLLSLGALLSRRDSAAGLLAASTIVKPHLAALYLLYLYVWGIKNQRWNLIGWLTTGLVVLLGVPTALLPSWPLDVARQVLDYADLGIFRSVVSRVVGSPDEPYSALTLIVSAVVLGYLFWEWRLSLAEGERSMVWAIMLTLTMTVALTPFATLANQVLLAPPLLLSARVLHERLGEGRTAHVGFLLAGLALLSWLGATQGLDPTRQGALVLSLPPLLAVLCLWWVRWWATRAPMVLEGVHLRPPA